MKILQDFSFDELKSYLISIGEKPYRASQIYLALHCGLKISEISNISKDLRQKLCQDFCDEPVKIIKRLVSVDGTEKYLFCLFDGNTVEGVFMKNNYGNTQCLSTQVGCRMGCKFCASTLGGLARNLTAGEMLTMVALVNRLNGGNVDKRAVSNIVLMGSGEPFDNYDNTIKFLKNISSKNGLNVGLRNISLSTCGIVPKMLEFANENLPVNLTVSLHQPFDEARKKLMPIANSYSISEILSACDNYFNKAGRRYIFEYSLVKGENDTDECANELIRLLKSRPCHVNVIRLNEIEENKLKSTSKKDAYKFVEKLTEGGLSATVRRLIGGDIQGACGQLRHSYLSEAKHEQN